MVDTTLATCRVDKETWKEFKQWASERGSNASTELNQFILRSLGRIDNNIDVNIDKDPTTLDEETTVTESVEEEEVTEQLADEKGLSGKELASKIGVRPEYLTRWKSGKNIPKEDSENYQAYQEFCNYRWEKKKGTNQAKYYQVV